MKCLICSKHVFMMVSKPHGVGQEKISTIKASSECAEAFCRLMALPLDQYCESLTTFPFCANCLARLRNVNKHIGELVTARDFLLNAIVESNEKSSKSQNQVKTPEAEGAEKEKKPNDIEIRCSGMRSRIITEMKIEKGKSLRPEDLKLQNMIGASKLIAYVPSQPSKEKKETPTKEEPLNADMSTQIKPKNGLSKVESPKLGVLKSGVKVSSASSRESSKGKKNYQKKKHPFRIYSDADDSDDEDLEINLGKIRESGSPSRKSTRSLVSEQTKKFTSSKSDRVVTVQSDKETTQSDRPKSLNLRATSQRELLKKTCNEKHVREANEVRMVNSEEKSKYPDFFKNPRKLRELKSKALKQPCVIKLDRIESWTLSQQAKYANLKIRGVTFTVKFREVEKNTGSSSSNSPRSSSTSRSTITLCSSSDSSMSTSISQNCFSTARKSSIRPINEKKRGRKSKQDLKLDQECHEESPNDPKKKNEEFLKKKLTESTKKVEEIKKSDKSRDKSKKSKMDSKEIRKDSKESKKRKRPSEEELKDQDLSEATKWARISEDGMMKIELNSPLKNQRLRKDELPTDQNGDLSQEELPDDEEEKEPPEESHFMTEAETEDDDTECYSCPFRTSCKIPLEQGKWFDTRALFNAHLMEDHDCELTERKVRPGKNWREFKVQCLCCKTPKVYNSIRGLAHLVKHQKQIKAKESMRIRQFATGKLSARQNTRDNDKQVKVPCETVEAIMSLNTSSDSSVIEIDDPRTLERIYPSNPMPIPDAVQCVEIETDALPPGYDWNFVVSHEDVITTTSPTYPEVPIYIDYFYAATESSRDLLNTPQMDICKIPNNSSHGTSPGSPTQSINDVMNSTIQDELNTSKKEVLNDATNGVMHTPITEDLTSQNETTRIELVQPVILNQLEILRHVQRDIFSETDFEYENGEDARMLNSITNNIQYQLGVFQENEEEALLNSIGSAEVFMAQEESLLRNEESNVQVN